MGSLGNEWKRLRGELERQAGPSEASEDKGAELRRALMIDILNEISRLRSLRGHGIHINGEPNIPPFDPVGEALGYPYTHSEFIEFAVRSVFEREHEKYAPEILKAEDVENLTESWVRAFEARYAKEGWGWDEVAQHGPPTSR